MSKESRWGGFGVSGLSFRNFRGVSPRGCTESISKSLVNPLTSQNSNYPIDRRADGKQTAQQQLTETGQIVGKQLIVL